ncbi:TlpA family protein disulfide reductase [Acidicapsa ligni]|uniref:TlpA family protein disulfide reductase n=1 Tax=Acidicapsa ligni TaxID=542300 RepID=UPI0021DFB646|nr:TlpA disulfide reductase family protein [Acidicapsa ligni]
MKRLSWMAAVMLLASFVVLNVGVLNAGSEKPASLSLRNLQGKDMRLSDLRGKIVVLNFWATWCGPCDAEMPMLVKAADKYKDDNVAFLGVSVDAADTQKKIPGYLEKRGISYPIWVGATDEDLKRLKLGEAVPATVFLDTDGMVRARILGQMRPGEIEERVEWLLGKKQSSEPLALVKHLDEK